MVVKRLCLFSACILLLLLSACNTSQPSKPNIVSFTSSPQTLPAGGGLVALTWNVEGATSLTVDRNVGVLTPPTAGTTATPINITQTTTFTLTALNSAGSTTQSLTVPVAVAGGGGNTQRPTITSFTVSPTSLPAGGGSVTLSWEVMGADSLSIDRGVGAVTPVTTGSRPNVQVAANTTFTLTATNAAGSSTRTVSVTVAGGGGNSGTTVIVTNRLLRPINIIVNQRPRGSVPAQSTAQTNVGSLGSLSLEWEVVQPTISGTNQAVGDDISGVFSTINNPPDRVNLTVDNIIGDDFIFFPLIENRTAVRLAMAVNYGLQAENRCDCTVSPGSTSGIGYYWLYSNSNVAAFRDATNYTGRYLYWDNFANSTVEGSGSVVLVASPVSGFSTRHAFSLGAFAVPAQRLPRSPPGQGDDLLDERIHREGSHAKKMLPALPALP